MKQIQQENYTFIPSHREMARSGLRALSVRRLRRAMRLSCSMNKLHMDTRTMKQSRMVQTEVKYLTKPKATHLSIISRVKSMANTRFRQLSTSCMGLQVKELANIWIHDQRPKYTLSTQGPKRVHEANFMFNSRFKSYLRVYAYFKNDKNYSSESNKTRLNQLAVNFCMVFTNQIIPTHSTWVRYIALNSLQCKKNGKKVCKLRAFGINGHSFPSISLLN